MPRTTGVLAYWLFSLAVPASGISVSIQHETATGVWYELLSNIAPPQDYARYCSASPALLSCLKRQPFIPELKSSGFSGKFL
jgi:hypothetical protein